MKKLLLLLLVKGITSCESIPKPCNQECWKITELHISEDTGSLKITHTNSCKKHLTFTTNVHNKNNYYLYEEGDIHCNDNFPGKKKDNPHPPSEVLTIIE